MCYTLPKFNNKGFSMSLLSLTKDNFHQSIKGSLPTLVEFGATWCGYCKMQEPILEALKSVYEGKINFVKVDTDECKDISIEFGVKALPTIILFNDGKIVAQAQGMQEADEIIELLKALE